MESAAAPGAGADALTGSALGMPATGSAFGVGAALGMHAPSAASGAGVSDAGAGGADFGSEPKAASSDLG